MNTDTPETKRPTRNIIPPPPRPKYIGEGELKCLGDGCRNGIPEGWYGNRRKNYFCSPGCESSYYLSKKPLIHCPVCDKAFHRRNAAQKLCSRECFSVWRKAALNTRVGRFLPLLEAFLDAYGQRSKATRDQARSNVSFLLAFLIRRRIRSLNSVRPTHITEFLQSMRNTGDWKNLTHVVNAIKLFFDWAIVAEKRKTANPVVPKFHGERRPKRLPRPFSEEELRFIRTELQESGDKALLAAVDFAADTAARSYEVMALTVDAIDLEKQEATIKLTKTGGAWHTVPFTSRAKRSLEEWLAVRGKHDHDFVFVGPSGKPMTTATLRKRLNGVLCGPGKLASFSFHRLRGRAATMMAKGKMDVLSIARTVGWRELSSASQYIDLDTADLHATFHRAMEHRADEKRERPVVQSLDEFFSGQGGPAVTGKPDCADKKNASPPTS